MASRRAQRRRECAQKVHHATRADAEVALRRTGKFNQFAESRAGLSTYACPQGDGWLVGHSPGSMVRKTSAGKAISRGRMQPRRKGNR